MFKFMLEFLFGVSKNMPGWMFDFELSLLSKLYGMGLFRIVSPKNKKLFRDSMADLIGQRLEDRITDTNLSPEDIQLLIEISAAGYFEEFTDKKKNLLDAWSKLYPIYPDKDRFSRSSLIDVLEGPSLGLSSMDNITSTIYQLPYTSHPQRIVIAGKSGDSILNNYIYTAAFMGCLGVKHNPSFVTGQCALIILDQESNAARIRMEDYHKNITIGPPGLTPEKLPSSPALGMEMSKTSEAITQTLGTCEDYSGLIQILRYPGSNMEEIQSKIGNFLAAKDGKTHVLDFVSNNPDEIRVIDCLPYLWQNPDKGSVEELKIPVPSYLFDCSLFRQLIGNSREIYLTKILEDMQKRYALARSTYEHSCNRLEWWGSLKEKDRQEHIAKNPTILIHFSVDLVLGITVRLDPPEKVPIEKYYNVNLPQLRDHAHEMMEKHEKTCEYLEMFNSPGGLLEQYTISYLLDTLIRNAPIDIDDEKFCIYFDKWRNSRSLAVQANMINWLKEKNIPSDFIFNSHTAFDIVFEDGGDIAYFRPHAIVAPNDFVVTIHSDIPLPEYLPCASPHKIRDLDENTAKNDEDIAKEITDSIKQWGDIIEVFHKPEEQKLMEKLCKVLPEAEYAIKLRTARREIFNGNIKNALENLKKIKGQDLAPIYFWIAVGEQALRSGGTRAGKQNEEDVMIAISMLRTYLAADCLSRDFNDREALNVIQESIRTRDGQPLDIQDVLKLIGDKTSLVFSSMNARALEALGQARGINEDYVRRELFLAKLSEDELKLMNIDDSQIPTLQAIDEGLAAIELFNLACMIKDTGDRIPVVGSSLNEVKGNVGAVLQLAKQLRHSPPPVVDELEKLEELLSGIKRK